MARVRGIEAVAADITTWPPQKLGLRLFLCTVTSVFSIFIVSYLMRMSHGPQDWIPVSEPRLLWLNTALLIIASVAFQRSRNAAERDQFDRMRSNLTAGGVLTIGFLAGQLWAWQQLNASGEYLTTGPASAFFYLLTAVHGIHLMGGLWVWGKATTKAWEGFGREDVAEAGKIRLSVQLCTVYWHYLLLVWLVLFGLLLKT
jgi:cytochrome c oxidase subunit 3